MTRVELGECQGVRAPKLASSLAQRACRPTTSLPPFPLLASVNSQEEEDEGEEEGVDGEEAPDYENLQELN